MTAAADHDALERRVRALCEAGDKRRAASVLLEGYGREVLGFLISHLRDRDAASEVFSRFAEDMWRGLDGFRWQCTARVWAYTIARHAASHYAREARRHRVRHRPLSQAGPISNIAERIRTETLASARTESRSLMVRLRERLPTDDQTLLILRLNRRLTWPEIAQVMLHEGEVVQASILEKEAVRLRQRYQAAKKRLQKMALDEGWVPPRDS